MKYEVVLTIGKDKVETLKDYAFAIDEALIK